MAIIERISAKATPFETQNRFAADFNNPTAGEYDFGIEAAPLPANIQPVLKLNKAHVYLIDRVSFSASIDEGVYLRSIIPGRTPEARLYFQTPNRTVYSKPFPCINYKDNLEWRFWFWSPLQGDTLQVRFFGSLDQVAETVGVDTIYAQLSLVIYEETNDTIIRRIHSGTCPDAGEFFSNG
jgi:hypothetical protein